MKKIRLGIIGSGYRGTLGDYAHDPANGVEIVAGTDIFPEQRAAFQERYRQKFGQAVRVYADYHEMIERENLDGVFITTPDYCHEEQACYALRCRVPVYLEKPLAITIEGADRILQTAYDTRTALMAGHNMRHMEFTNRMRELILAGAIGEVKAIWCRHFISYGGDAYFRDWHADRSNTTSLLLQKGAHDIDIIHWLANARSVRVNGFGASSLYAGLARRPAKNGSPCPCVAEIRSRKAWPPENTGDYYPQITNEDINMISMQLANGVQANYMQCHFTPDACRNYTVIGTQGRLENYGDCGSAAVIQLWNKRSDSFSLTGEETYRLSGRDARHEDADRAIVQSFVDILRGKAHPVSTPQGGRYAVATGFYGAQSIRNGGTPFIIPSLPEELEHCNFTFPDKFSI